MSNRSSSSFDKNRDDSHAKKQGNHSVTPQQVNNVNLATPTPTPIPIPTITPSLPQRRRISSNPKSEDIAGIPSANHVLSAAHQQMLTATVQEEGPQETTSMLVDVGIGI